MALVLNGPAVLDVTLVAASTLQILRGTTPPYKPNKIPAKAESASAKPSAKAAEKDLISSLQINSAGSLVHPLVVLEGIAAAYRILYPAPAADREQWLSVRNLWRIANVVTILGGLGRAWCYRTLGKHFTFDLRVNPDHKVVQSGPYSVVRHPSYTAVYLLAVGGTVGGLLLNPGIPLAIREGLAMRAGVSTLIAGTGILISRRIVEEEGMLTSDPSIGAQYQTYMGKVRSRLIPGIL